MEWVDKESWLVILIIVCLTCLALIDILPIKYGAAVIIVAGITMLRGNMNILGWCVVLLICIFSQWGIGQFVVQHSFGLQYIGESNIYSAAAGVAKFGNGIVRSYGPFEHANVFGGINLLGLILATWLCKSKNSLALKSLIMFILGMGIFVSFSRATLLGSIILCLIAIAVKEFRKTGILLLKILLILFIIFSPLLIIRANDSNDAAISERMRGYQWNYQLIKSHSLWVGLGTSNYKMELKKYLEMSGVEYKPWEIDYVHSIPLLIFAQIGLIGSSVILIVILASMIKTKNKCMLLFTGTLMPTLLLDHYWITQLSALIFLLTTIWVLSSEKIDSKKYV